MPLTDPVAGSCVSARRLYIQARRLATAEVDSSGEDGQLRILPPPSQSPEYLAARRPSRERGWVAPDERRMSADARQAYITAVGSGGHTAAADVRSKQRLGGDDGTAHLHAGVRGYVVANSHRRQLLEAEVTTAAPLSDEELASPVLGCLLCDGVTAALQVEAYQQLRARSGTGTLSSDGRYEVISSDVSWENACLNLRDYVVLAAGAGGGGYTVRHVGSHHEHSAVGDGFVDAVATAKLHAACPKYKGTLRLRDALAYQIAHAADPLGAVARREACALAMGAAGLQCATDVIMDL